MFVSVWKMQNLQAKENVTLLGSPGSELSDKKVLLEKKEFIWLIAKVDSFFKYSGLEVV